MPASTLPLALAAGLIVLAMALGLWLWLRARRRGAAAHTEIRSQTSVPAAGRQPVSTVALPPLPPSPAEPAVAAAPTALAEPPVAAQTAAVEPQAPASGPVVVLMTYTKADGSTRERRLQILSRNGSGDLFRSLRGRSDGERIVKTFLLSGISRLEVPQPVQPLVLTDPAEIRSWLERHSSPADEQSKPARRVQAAPSPPASARLVPMSGVDAPPVRADPPASLSRPPLPPPLPPSSAPPSSETPSSETPSSVTPPSAFLPSVSPAATASPSVQARPLPSLLPDGARGFAVLDLETTGKTRTSRIVEVALVRLDPQGRIIEEWETLVNPGIAIPNADFHGIDDALVQAAPRFAQIAGLLAAKLHEHVLVAHNLRSFDGPVLEAHFNEMEELELSVGKGLDTMPRPTLQLAELCSRHGVDLKADRVHLALDDTRALVQVLQRGLAHLTPAEDMVMVHRNGLLQQPCAPFTRAMAANTVPQSGWKAIDLQLEPGQLFYATGPQSMAKNTEINRAEAHGTSLGLTYRKVSRIAVKSPPVFLLSTSLELPTPKMHTARERQIPVVLCRDLMRARPGAIVRAWVHHPEAS